MYTTPSIGSVGPNFMTIHGVSVTHISAGMYASSLNCGVACRAEMTRNDVIMNINYQKFFPYLPSTACYAYVLKCLPQFPWHSTCLETSKQL